MRIIFVSIVLLLSQPVAANIQSAPLDGFHEYVSAAVEEWGAPGLAISVVKDGQVVFADGFGEKELGTGRLVDADTTFHAGSTTKAFVAMAMGMLVEDGLLSWNDRVIDHLPHFRVADPYVTRELRITDLFDHGSGIQTNDLLWFSGADRDETVRRLAFAEQAFSLRNSWQYNNNMYLLAGEVIDAVAGQAFEDFIDERILMPLDMQRTSLTFERWSEIDNKSFAHYPHPDTGEQTPVEYPHIYEAGGAGLVNASVNDYAKWMNFLLNGGNVDGQSLIDENSINYMWQAHNAMPQPLYPAAQLADSHMFGYGLGWFLQDYRSEKMVMHTGSIFGQAAIVGLLPEHDLGVTIFINGDHVEVRHALMYEVFDRFLGYDDDMDWSRELKPIYDDIAAQQASTLEAIFTPVSEDTTTSIPLEAFIGMYEHPYLGQIEVTMDGGDLRMGMGTRLKGRLDHMQYDVFHYKDDKFWLGEFLILFDPDNRGGIASVSIGGVQGEFSKIN